MTAGILDDVDGGFLSVIGALASCLLTAFRRLLFLNGPSMMYLSSSDSLRDLLKSGRRPTRAGTFFGADFKLLALTKPVEAPEGMLRDGSSSLFRLVLAATLEPRLLRVSFSSSS
jgi:hypothetical protein